MGKSFHIYVALARFVAFGQQKVQNTEFASERPYQTARLLSGALSEGTEIERPCPSNNDRSHVANPIDMNPLGEAW